MAREVLPSWLASYFHDNLDMVDAGRRLWMAGCIERYEFDSFSGDLYGYVKTPLVVSKTGPTVKIEQVEHGVVLKVAEQYGIIDAKCTCKKGTTPCKHKAALMTAAVFSKSKKIRSTRSKVLKIGKKVIRFLLLFLVLGIQTFATWRPNNLAAIDDVLSHQPGTRFLAIKLYSAIAMATQMAVLLKFTIAIAGIFSHTSKDKKDWRNYLVLIPMLILLLSVAIEAYLIAKASHGAPEIIKVLEEQMTYETQTRQDDGLLEWAYRDFNCCGIVNLGVAGCDHFYPPIDKCFKGSDLCQRGCLPLIMEQVMLPHLSDVVLTSAFCLFISALELSMDFAKLIRLLCRRKLRRPDFDLRLEPIN